MACTFTVRISLSDDKNVDLSKLKDCRRHFNVGLMMAFCLIGWKHCGKRRKCWYQHFPCSNYVSEDFCLRIVSSKKLFIKAISIIKSWSESFRRLLKFNIKSKHLMTWSIHRIKVTKCLHLLKKFSECLKDFKNDLKSQ